MNNNCSLSFRLSPLHPLLTKEDGQPPHQLSRLPLRPLEDMEDVILPLRLKELRLPPPPDLSQPLVISPSPVSQQIPLRSTDQNPSAPQRSQARSPGGERVHPRVIEPSRPGGHERPQFG
ncbi:hypothetical protein AXF42_Ash017075 [Apostasia shenzhenica]|uniref:Uncharacterized protein n=1 Tax=Apostasia shenzhenica TaxID=1088818 RepID=A0A2I0B7R4_9ASPA|nr:hypothetical protein AXF42_Ash017075 [Apostasia shenzhenica]